MSDDPFNPQPNPFHYWIIGVIIAVAIIVLLIFLRVVRYRQRYVRVQRPVYPTPSQVESGYNPDLITDTPPAYTPGRPPTYPAYPPEIHHHYHNTDIHHTTHVNVPPSMTPTS